MIVVKLDEHQQYFKDFGNPAHYHYLSAEVYEVGIRIIDGEHDAVADIKTVKSHTLILLTNVSGRCKWFRLYLC